MKSEPEEVLDALRNTAERFASERLAPQYQARERGEHKIDRALLKEMGELGLIAPELPEELGGLALGQVATGVITEAVSYGDFNVGYVQVFGSLLGHIIARHALPEIGARWVRKITQGEAIVAIALTEPSGGSDAANISTRALRKGDRYFISGEKTSISGAVQVDAFVVVARTGRPDDGPKGISAFLVPADSKGVSRTKFDDFGTKIVGRGSVFFDEVEVPADHRLGQEGQAFTHVMNGLDFSRVLIALQCIGAARASIDETWKYVVQRKAFGKSISEFQGVSFPLVEAEGLVLSTRQLCYHTLTLAQEGRKYTVESALAKMLGPKQAFDAIHTCLLLHGHYGYSMDLPHQQRMRDVMGLELGDGTEQIMKKIVARERTLKLGR